MPTYLGVDWGTHSSKWAFQTESGNPVIGPIWDSAVCRIDENLHLSTLDEKFHHPSRETALKRKLIQDPDQSFWEGPRPKLGVTLGQAVVFSLLSLLLDAQRTLETKGKSLTHDKSLMVRFSHPNWISEDNIRALSCYRDAAAVAMAILIKGIHYKREGQSITIPAKALTDSVHRWRDIVAGLPTFPPRYEHSGYLHCSRGEVGGANWELVFESCAAGFPYLLEGERDTFEETLTKFPASKRIRKILVIDVGAGSTDAGYMVRTIRPRDSKRIMKPLLIWLPAMDALEIAGGWLTDKILADFRQQGRSVTRVEAEDYKIGSDSWYHKPYVREWTNLICEQVSEYIGGIHDEVCLCSDPKLEIVLTGGSSVVEPLRVATLLQVRSALQKRGVGEGLTRATKFVDLTSPAVLGKSYRKVEVAQLAVSLGASDPHLAELKAYPTGLSQHGSQ